MFVTKNQIEERKAQMPRTRSYPATVYVRYANAESEAQGVPEDIELNIENEQAAVGCYLYISKLDEVGSADAFVKELQQLDAIAQSEGKRDAIS